MAPKPTMLQTTPLSLALQGGGSHAAFTWGVLDQFLKDERVSIEAISSTSAGAMLAVVLAQGLMEGGPEGARETLLAFWKKTNIAASLLPLRTTPVDKFLSNVGVDFSPSTMALDYLTRIFSPYQFNLFDINPLKSIVEELVDFRALRRCPVKLFINATHATSGKSRIFTNEEITLDVVMASACLPFIFKTAEVNEEPYWDGSFSGCPALAPLVENGARDIALVQVHPQRIDEVPTTATDILDRAIEIGFNAVLEQEIKRVEQMPRAPRLHRIEALDMLAGLGRASKLNADWDFLMHLHDLGEQAAADWFNTSPALVAGSGAKQQAS